MTLQDMSAGLAVEAGGRKRATIRGATTSDIQKQATATSQVTLTVDATVDRLRAIVGQLVQHNDELGMPESGDNSAEPIPDRNGLQGSIDDLVRVVTTIEREISRFS